MNQRGIGVARYLRSASVLVATVISSLLLPSVPPAHAQEMGWWFGNATPSQGRMIRSPRYSVAKRGRESDDRERRQANKEAAVSENKPTGPLFAILSISNQHISVYNSSGLVTRSKVSTGMPGHRTPTGIFTIIGRERYHSSNIYSGAPMPFMQRITWSGVAMHLGVVPGYPASHGCIRESEDGAKLFYDHVRVGTSVSVGD